MFEHPSLVQGLERQDFYYYNLLKYDFYKAIVFIPEYPIPHKLDSVIL